MVFKAGLANGRALLSVFDLFFLFDELAVEFICQHVNCCIKIFGLGVGENLTACQADSGFGLLSLLFNAQDDIHVIYPVKVPFQSVELADYIVAQGIGDIDMVTTNVDLHSKDSFALVMNRQTIAAFPI